MPHTIFYNSELKIIESKFQGVLTFNEVKEFVSEGAQIAKERNCTLFLSDYREVILNLSTLEIYEVPQLMQAAFALSELNIHRIKRAVVIAKNIEQYQFYETITVNRGQSAKLFYDIEEAKEWLLKK